MAFTFNENSKLYLSSVLVSICLSAPIYAQENWVKSSEPDLAEFILIGERHGVEQQQLMTAVLLDQLSDSGRKVGVIMEMISTDQAKLVETFRKMSPKSNKDFGYAIGWHKTSWPDYSNYAPMFDVIWLREMALAAGDPPAKAQSRWRKGDFNSVDYNPTKALTKMYNPQKAKSVQASWEASMQKAHCDQLGPEELSDVARLQMMRDAFMASQMRAMKAAGADVVVLIAGRAHVRRDRGVPLYLGPNADVQIFAIIEADPNEKEGETYQPEQKVEGVKPYDIIVLTDALPPKESSCDQLRRKGLIK